MDCTVLTYNEVNNHWWSWNMLTQFPASNDEKYFYFGKIAISQIEQFYQLRIYHNLCYQYKCYNNKSVMNAYKTKVKNGFINLKSS